jgi:hypothetical protein
MGYKLLGIVVWKIAKSLVRYRYRSVPVPAPKSLVAGGVVLAIAGVLFAVRSRLGDG